MATEIIKCPRCGRLVAQDDPLIAQARSGEGDSSQYIECECGAKVTFWSITAQIREQNTRWYQFKHWVRSIFNKRTA